MIDSLRRSRILRKEMRCVKYSVCPPFHLNERPKDNENNKMIRVCPSRTLSYKMKGRGFDSHWDDCIFSLP